MSDIKVVRIHAGQREEQDTTTGTKAWELFRDDADVIAARVGGELKDLAYELQDGDEVEGVDIASADGRDILRHSTAHVMAQAVQQLWPAGQARHRPAGRERLLLRLRRRDPVRARGPRQDRVRDAQDHQGEPALRAPGHHRRRRHRRAPGRALQARADRPQGRRRHRRHRGRERRGRSARASSPSTTTSAAAARPSGPTCAAARTCRPPSGSRPSS